MMSFTKPEVEKLLQCHQKGIETTAMGNMYKKFLKYRHAFFEICEWTDRHTYTHKDTDHNTLHLYRA